MGVSNEVLATLFEGAPGFVRRVSQLRSNDPDDLLDQAEAIAARMSDAEQIELLNAHPRIGARPSTLSAMSHTEQGYDRDAGSPDLQARLDALNEAYEARFGFRFVVFVAGRPRSQIGDLIESSLAATREAEKARAMSAVFAIARDRLAKLTGRTLEEVR